MTSVYRSKRNETKSDIFPCEIFKSETIFQWSQNTKIFQWLLLLATFDFIAKLSTNNYNDIKSNRRCANLTACFLIYKVVRYLNDFWNLFLDKVDLKMNDNCSRGKMFIIYLILFFKVPCRFHMWKKTFCQNSDKSGYSFIKNDIMFMQLLCIYKKTDILNFSMHILTILTCPLNTYVIRLHNLNSINVFFTITGHSFFFIAVKQKLKTNKLKKPLKTQNSDFFKSSFNELFLLSKEW